MGRRHHDDTDSLELLLDTITNAFGGIVFLAIMVTVLLKNSVELSPQQEPQTQPERSRASELNGLIAQREVLEKQVVANELVGELADPELKEKVNQLVTLRSQRDQLRTLEDANEEQESNAQAALEETQRQARDLDKEVRQAKAELLAAERELEAERASRKVTSPYPEERAPTKRPSSIVIRYGRLYRDRVNGRINFDDMAVIGEEGEFLVVTPKPHGGLAILTGTELTAPVQEFLLQVDPTEFYLVISIWDDSFGSFPALRDFMTEHGFEYRLILMNDAGAVIEGGATDVNVQ